MINESRNSLAKHEETIIQAPIYDGKQSRQAFAIVLFVLEIIVIIFYGIFIRTDLTATQDSFQTGYPFYQDVNVMMLIGFGFLMTFVKSTQWSALSYTFLINALVVQYYILFQVFWHKVVHDGWDNTTAPINILTFTSASYSVASILIAYGGVLGRVGPIQLLIMSMVGVIGYTLNQLIVYSELKLFDAGGSTAIHTYGAYFGLTVSAIISKVKSPRKQPQVSRFSNSIAILGTFFLWMYWPSFNAGYFPTTPFERSLIVTNTICSLVGSCTSAFVISSILRNKFSMEDILNATLAGGVAIGAPAGLITNPAASLTIGIIVGSISTLGFVKLTPKLHDFLGLNDTCGINNLHGIPGLLGGIFSAIVVAAYNASPLNTQFQANLPFSQTNWSRTYSEQAGIQIAGTGASLGMGLLFGFIAGMIMACFYKLEEKAFFNDKVHFEVCDDVNQKINNTSIHD